jgi:hypothetical protein
MAQARELGDEAMRNLARLREEGFEGMTTPLVPQNLIRANSLVVSIVWR